jgi:hypothetical protein
MAICQVWEDYGSGNNRQQVAMLPGGAVQNVTISSTHAVTSAFDNATIGIRVLSDTDCWILIGTAPVATASNGIKVLASQPEYFGVKMAAAQKLSIITA